MADVGEIRAKLVLNSDQFNRGLNDAKNQMDSTGKSALKTSKSIGMIQEAAIGVGAVVAASFAASVMVAANFEQKMKDIEAVSGATGAEMQQLGDLAKEMGEKTAFSASEAAMGIEELIKAGLTVEQVIGGGLQGALDLAIAGNLQLAEAAEIASTALNAFKDDNLSVADAANILAGAANASATDVGEMKFGLSAVATVAAGLGLSLQDTSTALAVFAQNGLKGSDAGTSLKTMLQNLQPTTKTQIELFEKLGLTAADGTNAFFDMNGEIRGMDEIAGILQNALKDMTDQQRAFALETIFGSDAVRAGNILYKEGADGLNAMWDAMSKVTAAEIAATKMDTLKGAFEELRGSVETVGIKLSENFLPMLTQVTRYITGVVRSIDDMDMANIKAALAFGGTAAAIGLVGASVGKLSLALRALSASPIGLAITAISLLGGIVAASVVHQKEMSVVTLDNANALDKQRQSLSDNITEYDQLSLKSRLTSDELARFVDINSVLAKTADPQIIAALTAEQDKLREKSGLSNEEIQRMVDLNGKIIEVVPESNAKLTEQGNILLNNTDKAKSFNAEQMEMVRLELEAQKAKAEANMAQYLTDEKLIISEIKTLKQEMNGLDREEYAQRSVIGGLEAELAIAKKNNDEGEQQQLLINLGVENQKLQKIQEQRAESAYLIVEKTKELEKVQEQIGKLDEVKRKMVDIELKQVGINATRGQEMKALDDGITKLAQQKQQMELNTPANMKNTQEYRNAVAEIDKQIAELNTVKTRIGEITGQAVLMNQELGRTINKNVNVTTTPIRVVTPGRGNEGTYHTGGLVGRGQMPMLHTGGLASQFANAPSHNEVDVRLLRNEMVLTEAQQANLMRLIDAGNTQGGNNSAFSANEVADIKKLLGAIATNTAQTTPVVVDGNALWNYVDAQQANAVGIANRMGGIKR